MNWETRYLLQLSVVFAAMAAILVKATLEFRKRMADSSNVGSQELIRTTANWISVIAIMAMVLGVTAFGGLVVRALGASNTLAGN